MQQDLRNITSAGRAEPALKLERENARLRARIAELEKLVSTDGLTALFNRRHFEEELARWCWRAHRYRTHFGLLFCDVDRLKAVNDVHGHATGDAILCGVAQALVGAVRKSDIVCRIGGDEIAVLLDNISPEKLEEKTNTLRAAMSALRIKTAGPILTIAVSVGSAIIDGGSKPQAVLDAADRDMYAHKRSKY